MLPILQRLKSTFYDKVNKVFSPSKEACRSVVAFNEVSITLQFEPANFVTWLPQAGFWTSKRTSFMEFLARFSVQSENVFFCNDFCDP